MKEKKRQKEEKGRRDGREEVAQSHVCDEMKGGAGGGATTTKSFQGGEWWKHSVCHLCLSVNTYLHMLVTTSCPRPGSLGVEVISVSLIKALKGKSSAREKKTKQKKTTALK